jgi:hypothetical protein
MLVSCSSFPTHIPIASRASSKLPDVSDLMLCSISFCDILLYSSNTTNDNEMALLIIKKKLKFIE